ncbi:uncharacterized protein ZK1073.1-like isoform X3 [Amphiura filiformis]|uniref:uncharacterized protein ZK1073.1-like isoform X3 n=1 Tax=Amphiura filiformis TaxID=82378 RepID=UPI003B21D307
MAEIQVSNSAPVEPLVDQGKGQEGSVSQPVVVAGHSGQITFKRVKTETAGEFEVYIQGNIEAGRFICLTYHDIGLNHTAFVKFLGDASVKYLTSKVGFVHINAPGQEPNAEDLPDKDHKGHHVRYNYPSMQQLADEIPQILTELGIPDDKQILGFGEGAGANILVRYADKSKRQVIGLVLLECTMSTASFAEWGQEKVASWKLTHSGMNPGAEKYILWHHLGHYGKDKLHVVKNYHENLYKHMNPKNLAAFINAFCSRDDISNRVKQIRCPVLLVTGDKSPHAKDVDKIFQLLPDKKLSSIMKAEDVGGDIKEEDPKKLGESFQYFLQGLGLISYIPLARLGRAASLGETSKIRLPKQQSMDEGM